MNIGRCFQYRINHGLAEMMFFNYFTYDLYPSIVVYNSAFNVYTVVYFVINFVLFFLVNTWIEFSLLNNLRKEIEEKRTKLENEIRVSQSKNVSGSEVINKLNAGKQTKIELDKKKETRATVMVIINSGFNFFLRLPEIFVFLSSNFTYLNSAIVSSYSHFANYLTAVMVNTSYLLYILTFTSNVAIYYFFNPNFKKLYVVFWERKVESK
jgi:hypothetical protein